MIKTRLFCSIILLFLIGGVFVQQSSAHQTPDTIVLLDVGENKVGMELQIPLDELELAFGHDVNKNTATLVERLSPQLTDYLKKHIRPRTAHNQLWTIEVREMKVSQIEQIATGIYQEIVVRLELIPPSGVGTRNFVLDYDLIMHQVVNHVAFVSVRNDWELGNIGAEPIGVGVIFVDTHTTKIEPLEINLQRGNSWNGFSNMVGLGMRHIREGTDHLLFLLVLLLPAMLLVDGKKWGSFAKTKSSLRRLFQIVTAFTLGHSVTLLVGAFGWLQLPPQPIEVLIAVSILVSAAHAVRPIFPGRESLVAAGFGLVHGLAFATVLSELQLNTNQLILSLLGFNLGIELMQLFVIGLIVPWLILLALTPFYQWVRMTGATLASVAAVFWIVERVSGEANAVGSLTQNVSQYAHFGILILAFAALLIFARQFWTRKNSAVI